MGEKTSPIRLEALNVPGCGRPIEITGDGVSIGRDRANDVVVASVDFPHVSGRHARVALENGSVVVRDLGSKNGTLVDGRQIEEHVLTRGEIVQLGYRGPKFLVTDDELTGEAVDATFLETVDVAPSRAGLEREAETILRVKRAVDEAIRARGRRHVWIAIGLGLVSIAVVAGTAVWWKRDRADDVGQLASELEDWRERVEQDQRELRRLREEHRRLSEELARVKNRGSASADEIEELLAEQRELEATHPSLRPKGGDGGFPDSAVSRVKPAVVQITIATRFRQRDSGEYLYLDDEVPNFDRRGARWSAQSLGSGVCVSPEGEILTNAHVVEHPGLDDLDFSRYGWTVDTEQEIRVTFVDQDRSWPAELVRKGSGAADSLTDVALLAIEAGAGREFPHVADFRTDAPPPDDGASAWLLSFPLGAFDVRRGVVTHRSGFLSFDSAINRGASGGPLVDSSGRIIGLAKGRRLDSRTGEPIPGMGVAVPIRCVREVWPDS